MSQFNAFLNNMANSGKGFLNSMAFEVPNSLFGGLSTAINDTLQMGPTYLASAGLKLLTRNWQNANDYKWQQKAAEKDRQFNAQQAQIARDWNLEMDNTKYQRQVADMQNAGINPALAMNGGVSTQAASNATASSNNSFHPVSNAFMNLIEMKQAMLQSKNIEKQNESIQADIKLKESEERLNNSKATGQDILNGKQDEILQTQINEANERINKLIEETNSEKEKQALYKSQALLAKAEATEIETLLPYNQAYLEAKTEEARAQAALAYVKAASEQQLIDGGYFLALAEEAGYKADYLHTMSQEEAVRKLLSDLEFARRTGKLPNGQDYYKSGIQKKVMTGIYQMRDILGGFASLGSVSFRSESSESSSSSHGSSSSSSSVTKK